MAPVGTTNEARLQPVWASASFISGVRVSDGEIIEVTDALPTVATVGVDQSYATILAAYTAGAREMQLVGTVAMGGNVTMVGGAYLTLRMASINSILTVDASFTGDATNLIRIMGVGGRASRSVSVMPHVVISDAVWEAAPLGGANLKCFDVALDCSQLTNSIYLSTGATQCYVRCSVEVVKAYTGISCSGDLIMRDCSLVGHAVAVEGGGGGEEGGEPDGEPAEGEEEGGGGELPAFTTSDYIKWDGALTKVCFVKNLRAVGLLTGNTRIMEVSGAAGGSLLYNPVIALSTVSTIRAADVHNFAVDTGNGGSCELFVVAGGSVRDSRSMVLLHTEGANTSVMNVDVSSVLTVTTPQRLWLSDSRVSDLQCVSAGQQVFVSECESSNFKFTSITSLQVNGVLLSGDLNVTTCPAAFLAGIRDASSAYINSSNHVRLQDSRCATAVQFDASSSYGLVRAVTCKTVRMKGDYGSVTWCVIPEGGSGMAGVAVGEGLGCDFRGMRFEKAAKLTSPLLHVTFTNLAVDSYPYLDLIHSAGTAPNTIGPLQARAQVISAATTITDAHMMLYEHYLVNTAGVAYSITLPAAADHLGRTLNFRRYDATPSVVTGQAVTFVNVDNTKVLTYARAVGVGGSFVSAGVVDAAATLTFTATALGWVGHEQAALTVA